MGAFSDLVSQLDADDRIKGRQFERICQWFLTNDPTYKSTLRRVWLWDEWVGRWGGDAGIDLVAEDLDGRLWAIQAKAYKPENAVTKADVDKFLSESSRAVFSYRLLIATTDKRHHVARRTMDDQEKKVGFVGLSDLLTSEVDWPRHPNDLRPSRPPKPARPREHQREAIRDVMKGFTKSDRGQLIMACGTGKTLTSLFVREKLAAGRTLVLVPSLSLLKQTMQVWRVNAKVPFVALPVCSDETVGASDTDPAVGHTSELGVPVTTDPSEIAAFMRRRSGPLVVFSTYQSSPQIAAAFALGRVPAFDLVVADEAHRVAGVESSDFATVLDAMAIKAQRRLFMTATPRYYTGRVLKAAQEADLEVASMDDPSQFGSVFYRLSFSEAICRDLLTDYQVAVVGVDDETYLRWAEKGMLLTRDGKRITDARTLAGQIGLAKAMRRYDLHKVISFHSRVKRSREFSAEMPDVIAWMPVRQRPKGVLWSRHASGEMSAGERHVLLQQLSRLNDGERGLLSNARCLAEGVDVPTLDGVAFIDPRRSEVDIVQAVGRAIRKSADKHVGTIVIPVFIDTDEDPEIALESSVFKPVWDVIKALRAHDTELGEQLDTLRREMGRGGGSPKLPDKIHLDLPLKIGADFATAFEVRLIEQTTTPWEQWFGLLQSFVNDHGHARVPQSYKVNRYQLGKWVNKQRATYARGNLDTDRQQRLQNLPGWTWEPKADQWELGFSHLLHFVENHGHARVPLSYTADGYRLGTWVIKQRGKYSDCTLDADRQQRLQELPGWTWDTLVDKWEESFRRLVDYVEIHGDARAPASYTVDGYALGAWVVHQRSKHSEGTLDADRQQRLQELAGWTWDPFVDRWEEGISHLLHFVEIHGHARVPRSHIVDGFPLATWTTTQRGERKKGRLDADRERRLMELPGWTWDPVADRWEEGFSRLVDYMERHGDARVPQSYLVDGYNLGSWVNTQRSRHNQKRLESDRAQRLAELPGWVWSAREAKWDEGFQHLREFAQAHRNVAVPIDYEAHGFKLRNWLVNNRVKFARLSQDRQRRLQALPGWDNYSHDVKWEKGFQHLIAYVKERGDAKVERSYVVDGYPLGSWAMTQRLEFTKGRLAKDRVERLAALPGWDWDRRRSKWEEGHDRLVEYLQRNGSPPPQGYVDETGYRLAAWVSQQRHLNRTGELDPDRWERMNKLRGWEWNPPRGAVARRRH